MKYQDMQEMIGDIMDVIDVWGGVLLGKIGPEGFKLLAYPIEELENIIATMDENKWTREALPSPDGWSAWKVTNDDGEFILMAKQQ